MRAAALALLGLLGAGAAAAQEPWRSSYFPYVLGTPVDGPTLVFRWQRTRNAPYFISRSDAADVINPITFRGALSAEAGIGTLGSRFARVEFRAPGLVDRWRFRWLAAAERQGRLGYYGVGGDIERARAATDPNDGYFRAHRTRYLVQGDLTREIAPGLRLALGVSLDRTELSRMPDSSRFAIDHGASLGRTNLVLRPALVFDTRDREFTPASGVLLEGGAGIGTGGDAATGSDRRSYRFGYAHLRGYLQPRDGTVIAARVFARTMGEHAPLSARFGTAGWEREFSWSGPDGHRSFPTGALASTDGYLLSLEVRHDLLNAGDLGAITAVGFTDFAHLDDPAATFRPATDQWGGGAGLALRVLRSAIISINFAGGANGFAFSMGTGWAF